MSKLETNTNILNMLSLIDIDNSNNIDRTIKNKIIDGTITEYSNEYITSIRYRAFYYCDSLKSIDLPNVTSIGEDAFYYCYSLTNINLPKVTSIGNNTFYYCQLLTNINLPKVTSIGYSAFYSCNKLTSIDLPNVTSIGNYAFNQCKSLTSINLPNVTNIGDYAFNRCTSLTSIIIRTNSICTLATNVFYNTPIASGTGYIYVPRALVDSYKSAAKWSTFANQIRAIEDYPDICG